MVSFLTASSWSAEFTLTWSDNSDNELGFKIERSLDGSNFLQIDTVLADSESYTDPTLDPSTEYWFRVRSYNAGGESEYTNTVNGITTSTLR